MNLHTAVFNQQVWSFFCDDLESCLEVSRRLQKGDRDFKGGLNFTACLTIFSVIEMCSGYYKGKDSDINTISEFLTKYLTKYFSLFEDRDFSRYFYYVFRDGLSHQWSPKGSGIAMDFKNNYLIGILDGSSEEILTLNIPVFYRITKEALRDYEKDLDENEILRDLFKTRYEDILELDYKKMRILRSKVKRMIHE
ncbi:MAG: hypothetical protein HYT07_01365 [Candidatus Levybacteria bacterium]|nr:hypothetical protein [Candidatus Levybacteria bacterium]